MAVIGANSGDGIDMVGCHDGLVARNTFSTRKAVQMKGGSHNIEVRNNKATYLDSGNRYRAFSLGQSTALGSFRPPLAPGSYEGKDIRLISNLIIGGGEAAIAFGGCVDCMVANNTIVDPIEYVARILVENTDSNLQRVGNGRWINNLVYWDPSLTSAVELQQGIGVTDLEAGSFLFRNHLWRSHPNSGANVDKGSGIAFSTSPLTGDPLFVGVDLGNYRIQTGSAAAGSGIQLLEVQSDMDGNCYDNPPSIGAYKAP